MAGGLWRENKVGSTSEAPTPNDGGSIGRAAAAMATDPRILAVGAVQSLFEGAMYIFVLQVCCHAHAPSLEKPILVGRRKKRASTAS